MLGFTSVDQRQPGRNTARPMVAPATVTTWISPCSRLYLWSGVSRFFAASVMLVASRGFVPVPAIVRDAPALGIGKNT